MFSSASGSQTDNASGRSQTRYQLSQPGSPFVDKSDFCLTKFNSVEKIEFCLNQKLFSLQKSFLSDKIEFCRQNWLVRQKSILLIKLNVVWDGIYFVYKSDFCLTKCNFGDKIQFYLRRNLFCYFLMQFCTQNKVGNTWWPILFDCHWLLVPSWTMFVWSTIPFQRFVFMQINLSPGKLWEGSLVGDLQGFAASLCASKVL